MKFEKGQWYQYKEHFWQYDDNCFRHAGDEIPVKNLSYANKLTPASLTPDFSGAKVGDECFDPIHGDGIVECIPNIGDGVVYSSSYRIRCKNTIYHVDSNDFKFQPNLHPTLFNSFAQFLAYWQEEALKLKGGSDA